MWFRRVFRRRRQPPLVLLPSLDRLAELIERVVALLDQVSLAPEPAPSEEIVLKQHNPEPVTDGWVALVPSPEGYRLLQRDGPPPDRGAALELGDGAFLVLRLGPSPLPGDRRRCAFLGREAAPSGSLRHKEARQEPAPPERTFDR